MLAIYKREVRSYFNSMIGCVFAAFLTIIGGVYFMVYNLYSGYPFFAYSLAGVIFMLLISVPVLSMKSFAEDRKNKTDQLLLTSPVSLVEIVLGKYSRSHMELQIQSPLQDIFQIGRAHV